MDIEHYNKVLSAGSSLGKFTRFEPIFVKWYYQFKVFGAPGGNSSSTRDSSSSSI